MALSHLPVCVLPSRYFTRPVSVYQYTGGVRVIVCFGGYILPKVGGGFAIHFWEGRWGMWCDGASNPLTYSTRAKVFVRCPFYTKSAHLHHPLLFPLVTGHFLGDLANPFPWFYFTIASSL